MTRPSSNRHKLSVARGSDRLSSPLLWRNGGIIGVLDVVNKAGGFTEKTCVMSVFANQAAMAIEHARLQRQAEQLAVLENDGLLLWELHDSVTQSLYSVTLYANAAALALAAGGRGGRCRLLSGCRRPREKECDMRLLIFRRTPPYWRQRVGRRAARHQQRGRRPRRAATQFNVRSGGCHRARPLLDCGRRPSTALGKHAGSACDRASHFTAVSVLLEVIDDRWGSISSGSLKGRAAAAQLAERTERLGGRLTHEIGPGQGTRLAVEVTL